MLMTQSTLSSSSPFSPPRTGKTGLSFELCELCSPPMLNRGKNGSRRTISFFSQSSKNHLQTAEWLAKPSVVVVEETITVHGVPLTIDRVLLADRSSKVATVLATNPFEDLSLALRDMPGDGRTFEQVARFCHGHEPAITSRNAILLFCMARYLGMTEEHSPGNLLARVSGFIRDEILPSWSETVKAFTSSEAVIEAAAEVGLVDVCVASIVSKAASDPRRVADLTAMPLRLYERVVVAMIRDKVLSRHVASSISQYVKKWVSPFVSRIRGKEVIEAVERMLPEEGGLVPCAALFEMLRLAIILDAGSPCRNGLERRIGRRLDLATAKDLVILLRGDAKEAEYDVDCVKRMLKIFYGSFADRSGSQEPRMSGLVRVAALMEEFLAEVAGDEDLKLETFTQLAELAAAASSGTNRCSDGIYRAIHIYLVKHGPLTEVEQDKVCRVLDCRMMSPEAVEHAARNERLPLRVVVQAVLADQMRLRSVIARAEEERGRTAGSETDSKVTEMGRGSKRKETSSRDGGGGLWKEMKRKFGWISSIDSSSLDLEHDYDCQGIKKRRKVHPRN